MLFNLFLTLHVIVCIALIVVVLLQSSKGGGLAGAFGGGGGQTMFGGQETATFLSRTTTYLAVAFMVLSLSLAMLSARRSQGVRSVVREAAQRRQQNTLPRQSIEEILGAGLDSAGTDSAGGGAVDTTAGGR